MRLAQVDQAYVNRVIRNDELFSLRVPLEEGCALSRLGQRWIEAIAPELGVNFLQCARKQQMEVLEFSSVGEHEDGMLDLALHGVEPGPDGKRVCHNFSLVQLRGCGWLEINGARHRIEPGDVYVFDQSLTHAWVQDGSVTSRVASFWMEHSTILERAARLGKRRGRNSALAAERGIQGHA